MDARTTEALAWPDAEMVEAFVIDVNGVPRGKWIPRDRVQDLQVKGVALPRSIYALDIWGRDVDEAGLAIGTGDPDGICLPVAGTIGLVPWLGRPTAQVMLSMVEADGSPFYGDPRQVLARVLRRYEAAGLRPVVAVELEFYLIDQHRSATDPLRPPNSRKGRWHGWQTQVLSIAELHAAEPILSDIFRACAAQNIPADTAVRENGPSQYEINLRHVDDALVAADHAAMLKRAVKGIARQHGLDATFMAKPYGDCAGNGMHVHMSILGKDGGNIFVGSGEQPADALRHAVGGMLTHMADSMLLFAPHCNSYRRLRPGAHAPTRASWGYDNRTAAVRVVTAPRAATRIEHRVAGGDANPYLVLAAILAAALDGIEAGLEPGAPMQGESGIAEYEKLPINWDEAIGRFERSDFIRDALGAEYRHLYAATKQQEQAEFRLRVTDVEFDAYLMTV